MGVGLDNAGDLALGNLAIHQSLGGGHPLAAILLAPPILILGGIALLQKFTAALYGERAAGHVAGELMVGLIAWLGSAIVFLAVQPARVARRLVRMRGRRRV